MFCKMLVVMMMYGPLRCSHCIFCSQSPYLDYCLAANKELRSNPLPPSPVRCGLDGAGWTKCILTKLYWVVGRQIDDLLYILSEENNTFLNQACFQIALVFQKLGQCKLGDYQWVKGSVTNSLPSIAVQRKHITFLQP